MIKKLISIFLTMCMVLTMVPTVAWAATETTGTFGDFTVTYSGTAPTFSSNILTFAAAGESYTVGMAAGKTSTSNCIMVSAENVTLNFNGVNIVATSGNALTVTGSNATLNIISDSSLTGTSDIDWQKSGSPGINGNVSISGANRLTVTGGKCGMGGQSGPGINGNVSVSGTVDLIVTGGGGSISCKGGPGIAGNVSASGTAQLTVTGGNGGNGATGGTGITGDVTASGTVQLTVTGGNGDNGDNGGTGITGNVSVSEMVRLTVTGGNGNNGGNGGTGIGGTITADTRLVVMAGSSPTPTDILTGNTTTAQYVTIAPRTAQNYATSAASGTDYELDTGSKTLIIKTAKGAAFWSASGTTYLDYAVKLANDIDVSAFLWTPVGTEDAPFTGTFDGQGHTITGIKVDVSPSDGYPAYAGLFGFTNGATIKNIGLIGSSVTATSTYDALAGSIASVAKNTTITNCYNTGNVSATSSNEVMLSSIIAGGIVGVANNSNITNCYSTGSVSATAAPSACSGGIVGNANGGTVTNCYYLKSSANKGIGAIFGTVTVQSCGTFVSSSSTLTAGTATQFGNSEDQTLTYGSTLLAALNGWVNDKASTDYYTWKADSTTPKNGGYPVFGSPWVLTLTGTVTFSGTQKYGETLTATYVPGNNTGALSYQWKRGSTNIGTNSNTYTLVKDDIGQTLTCAVTSTEEAGSVTSGATDAIAKADGPAVTGVSAANCTTASNNDGKLSGVTAAMEYKKSGATDYTAGTGSDITGLSDGDYLVRVKETDTNNAGADSTFTVAAYVPTLTGTVTISGTQKYGETLTAAYGSGNNTGTLSYQWKRGSTKIGTNSNTYTLVKDDIGKALTCEVTSTVEAGSVTSDATSTIAKADGPAVSGVSAEGCTTASNNDGKLSGVTADMEYKKSGATDYTAGTGSDITGLSDGDYLVRVKETDTNNAGADSTFTVVAYVPTLTGTVTISGTQKYGETLTAAYDSGNNTGTLSYQWKRGSTNIGTNSNTYTLVKDDIGQTLTCSVASTKETGSVTSGATDAIAKADGPAVSGVSAEGCTTSGNNDGKLIGVTADMEYKKSGAATYTAGTGSDITGLSDGEYLVRVKETDTNNAGADSTFTVQAMSAVYKTLVSIADPQAITNLANGTDKTAAALGLPGTVELTTDNGTVSADVNWDLVGCDYIKSKTTEQTFTVHGAVTLPAGVVNPNLVALRTKVDVTVKAAGSENPNPKTITGFLLDYTTKTVPYGTALASLNLPGKIQALGNSISNLWVNVTNWVCGAFQPNVPGTYSFKAVLDSGYKDSGYVLDRSVSMPEIKVTVNSKNSSRSSSTSSSSTADSEKTETKVDKTDNTATVTTKPDSVNTNGDTADIETTVSSVTVDNTQSSTNGDTVDSLKKAAVTIKVPTEAIMQQLAAKKNVDLTITVPSGVAANAVSGTAVTILANREILEEAKASQTDITIKIKDADTQQLAYTWTFRGEDLAKSATPMTDVNIAMSVHLTTEVPKVNAVTPSNKGLVLSFDHSGVLPSVASVKFSAREKGFQPGQTLYFYYFNPTTKQIESLGKDAYTVDADGNVTVKIYHCSDYVLLPKQARTITLDTRTYTMKPNNSYEIGVKLTGISNPIIKAYSSTKGTADVTVLKNGNVKANGRKPGLTYIMIDVYDSKNKFLTHASVRLTVQNGIKENGNSARQYGIF